MKLGFAEILVIVVVAMVFIGPDKLPMYARKAGKMLNQLKAYTGEATKEVRENIVEPLEEIQAPLKEVVAPLNDMKKDLDDSMNDVKKSFTGIGKASKEKAVEPEETPVDLTEEAPVDLTEQPAEVQPAEKAEAAAPAAEPVSPEAAPAPVEESAKS